MTEIVTFDIYIYIYIYIYISLCLKWMHSEFQTIILSKLPPIFRCLTVEMVEFNQRNLGPCSGIRMGGHNKDFGDAIH